MTREITRDALPTAALRQRLRGYDRQQTDQLLAELSTCNDRISAERDALAKTVADGQLAQEKRELRSRAELDELTQQLRDRERYVVDLEEQLAAFEDERSKKAEEIRRLSEELASAHVAEARHNAELAEQQESVTRFEVREKALVEQLTILKGQFQQESTDAHALPPGDHRAAARLLRLDRVVETMEREARRQAEVTLKKARKRAEAILHAAEARRRQLDAEIARLGAVAEKDRDEFDPVAALEGVEARVEEPDVSHELKQHVGEALWTSRVAFDKTLE